MKHPQADKLRDLAKQINQHHIAVQSNFNSAIERAQLCGKALCDAKEEVPHGKWIEWLQTNCPFISIRNAQIYMKASTFEASSDLGMPRTIKQLSIAAGVVKDKQESGATHEPTKNDAEQLKRLADSCVRSGAITIPNTNCSSHLDAPNEPDSIADAYLASPKTNGHKEPELVASSYCDYLGMGKPVAATQTEPVSHVEQSPTAPETFGLTSQFVQGCLIEIKAHNNASVSFLQRHFRLGYSKAAAVIHELERLGHIGPALGTEPRVIYEAETPPSLSDTKLQDPTPGAPMGTGVSGGEIPSREAMLLRAIEDSVETVMRHITSLGEGQKDSIVAALSPIFQYGRCRGVEGL